jgi:hypothetical protein
MIFADKSPTPLVGRVFVEEEIHALCSFRDKFQIIPIQLPL